MKTEEAEGRKQINKFHDTESTWHYYHWVKLRNVNRVSSIAWGMQKPIEFPKGTEQRGVAVLGKGNYSAEKEECLQ